MKKNLFLILAALLISFTIIAKTVNLTVNYVGSALYTALSKTERDTISSLTITGSFNAADFRIMRDSMPSLKNIDMGDANIDYYSGRDGTNKNILGQTNITAQDTDYSDNRIPKHAFENNKSIRTVILPKSATSMNLHVFKSSVVEAVTLPPNITSIPDYTFEYDSCLVSLNIPTQVTSIGVGAFSRCRYLKSVIIPSSVTSIGDYAFDECLRLASITCRADYAIDLSNTIYPFLDVNQSTCILYVPKGRTGQYQTADKWRDFYYIEEEPTNDSKNAALDNVQINTGKGVVSLSNLPLGETVSIYSLQAATIYSQKTQQSRLNISLPAQGVYILRIGNASRKFVY